jgi:hypothetical protein
MQTYTDMARGMLYGNETEVQANAPGVPCASDAAGTIHENEGDNPDKDKTSNKVKKDDKNANGVASRRSSKSSDAKPHTDLFLQPGPTAAAVHSAYQQGQNGAAAPQGMNPHLQLM